MLRKPHMRNHHIVCCSLSATIYNPGQKGRVVFGVVLNYSEFGYVCEKVMTGLGAYFCYVCYFQNNLVGIFGISKYFVYRV